MLLSRISRRLYAQPQRLVKETSENVITNSSVTNTNPLGNKVSLPGMLGHPRVQQLNRFLSGPLRNRLLISREVLRIVAREQQLLPSLNSWPQAKQAYIDSFNALRHQIQLFGVSGLISRRLQEATWGQVGRTARNLAELASFYYIGMLAGQVGGFFLIN